MPRKLGFRKRLANALAALRGEATFHEVGSVTIGVDIDAAKFNAALDTMKERLDKLRSQTEELATASTPPPRMLLQCDRPLSYDKLTRLRETFGEALKSGQVPIIEQPGLVLYQLIDGCYQPLTAIPTRANAKLVEVPLGQR